MFMWSSAWLDCPDSARLGRSRRCPRSRRRATRSSPSSRPGCSRRRRSGARPLTVNAMIVEMSSLSVVTPIALASDRQDGRRRPGRVVVPDGVVRVDQTTAGDVLGPGRPEHPGRVLGDDERLGPDVRSASMAGKPLSRRVRVGRRVVAEPVEPARRRPACGRTAVAPVLRGDVELGPVPQGVGPAWRSGCRARPRWRPSSRCSGRACR